MPSDERRDQILDAALKVFAERGFHGATTRELAKASGVSEALMFRHFPSKEDLYLALQSHCCQAKSGEKAEMLGTLEDSTASLVTLVHYMMAKMLRPPDRDKLEACLRAAVIAGDAIENPVGSHVGAWFVQHFAAMLMLNEMPGKPVVALNIDRSAQVEQSVWFALQGLGVKTEAIRRHYHPQAFALLMS
jgi:AcrR family transcriptional regulator